MNKLSGNRVSFDENTSVSEIDAVLTAAGLERVGYPENVDGEVIYNVRSTIDEDLCEKWLGRDWPENTTPAEAMRLATACQARRDAGDARDYNDIVAEVLDAETAT